MITFLIALALLICGYMIYGRIVNNVFGPDNRETPAISKEDGVDYIVMPSWKVFMIQFLNIAGLGPIFGAIMGAQFGTASFLWIVFGTIFAGAVHDFFAGTISIRNGGESLTQTIRRYLGSKVNWVMIFLTVLLMLLVTAVFTSGPAEIIASLTPDWMNAYFWMIVIFAYYILATLLPIDKIIGKIYPLFAFALIFMAIGIMITLFVKWPDMPEIWESMGVKYDKSPIFPMMFVSIACGAISGFHATQSPLMARCMKSEHLCRPIFYGAMVTEGIVALVWAAAATVFFSENGIIDAVSGKPFTGAMVATRLSKEWLGPIGGVLAILGIVAAPISTGDTALRSCRLIIADLLKIEQKNVSKRLLITVPIALCSMGFLIFSLSNADGFKIIWRYFAWTNQTLSVFTLWAITVFLARERKGMAYLISLIPAMFMTAVSVSYIVVAPEGLHLVNANPYLVGGGAALILFSIFVYSQIKYNSKRK
ncbi:MAG: carbon starvation protein A [Bacteroidaceae bacterium]|nr:carbon starvation protein A [Bacteroidaceae bacterium]